jgi:DNA mismatch repair protein PMS2
MSIKALQSSDVQKICNGQVIVDLATAVKELVENALDAGATNIEIKLKEMGFESFEVIDNGMGIDPVNYDAVALKHHTSKIIDFNDLLHVSSFGFRGEALNALCELSGNFGIITKQGTQEIGNTLSFARNGKLLDTKSTPRNTGTTVLVENLFDALPVRRSEFSRSIKKHYQKLIRILQSYAVISVGVKIVVMNFTKGVKQVVIGTQGSNSIEDNISSVFGGKFLTSLMTINLSINKEVNANTETGNDEVVMDEGNLPIPVNSSHCDNGKIIDSNKVECSISGYVSKAGLGVGRSDNDRQFIFCNGRPVDLPKVTKVINEVWRRYEMKQKPACILNIKVPSGTFDVNLTPDKREIVLAYESVLLDSLREEIDVLYAPSRYTFQVSQGINGNDKTIQSDLLKFEFTNTTQEAKQDKSIKGSPEALKHEPITEVIEISDTEENENNINSNTDSTNVTWLTDVPDVISGNVSPVKRSKSNSPAIVKNIYNREQVMSNEKPGRDSNKRKLTTEVTNNEVNTEIIDTTEPNSSPIVKCRSEGSWKFKSKNIIESYKNASTNVVVADINNKENTVIPTGNSLEDPLLCRVLNKSDFLKMRVLGQFNLGFIIAQLNGDLYILDQHSCDEKYKFETLQKTTTIHQQPLIVPLKVEVSAAEELVIMDNLSIFEANGFKLNIDKSDAATPGSRIYLEAIPYSKSTKFGVEDIHELASMLSENNDEGLNYVSKLTLTNEDLFVNKSKICLPKFISMFASRACRSAVMIGKALTMNEMKAIVNNLATIEQPWNCPHGRPTLRHIMHFDSFTSC